MSAFDPKRTSGADGIFRPFQCSSLSRYDANVSPWGENSERRDFITLVGGAVAAGCPLGALAQQPIRPAGKTPHVGVLMPGPTAHSTAVLGPFYQGLHDLG